MFRPILFLSLVLGSNEVLPKYGETQANSFPGIWNEGHFR